jgi:hypothetical protein
MKHKYKVCTIEYNDPHSHLPRVPSGGHGLHSTRPLAICEVCGGMEGSLLPECPGVMLTPEQDKQNYAALLRPGTGLPFAEAAGK